MIVSGFYIGYKKLAKGDKDKDVTHAEEHATIKEQIKNINENHKTQKEEQKEFNSEINKKINYILRLLKIAIKKKEKENGG